ncbi:PREDICTED: C-C motif chemokine 16 [Colobus angolensis palliatus]|uniref:C-C motif chemokine 16 n=1 Tax=Colobus angolensis palliatus TaxID=336983 RepID=UPI0005F4E1E8|nr:PREDICTED: C-C motif chemokine 16 [Colobus angolensis palliatus]
MKVSEAPLSLLILILILIITSASCSQPKVPEWVNTPSTCCLKFYEKVLPRRLVVGYRKALNCDLPAIIFITKRNQEVCTNPSDNWVQEYIKNPNLLLLPSRNLAMVKIITAKNDKAQLLNSQ